MILSSLVGPERGKSSGARRNQYSLSPCQMYSIPSLTRDCVQPPYCMPVRLRLDAALDDEARVAHRVDDSGQRPVLVDDVVDEPSDVALALAGVVGYLEEHVSLVVPDIPVVGVPGRSGDGMLLAEEQDAAVDEEVMAVPHQPVEVLGVVEGERAVHHVEALVQHGQVRHRHPPVLDSGGGVLLHRHVQHPRRYVNAQHTDGAALDEVHAVAPIAASYVEHPPACHLRQERVHRRLL